MRRALLAIAVVVGACTAGSSSEPAPATATTHPTTTVPTVVEVDPDGPGAIVAVDGEVEIVVLDPAGGPGEVINADDGTSLARQPLWSPDGTEVAWSAVEADGTPSIRWRALDGASAVSASTPSLAFYLAFLDGGDRLAWLGNAAGGVGLSVIDRERGETELLDVDAPHYLDGIDGGPLVTHGGGEELRTIRDGRPERIAAGTPAMQAPEVAPDGSIVVLVDDRDELTIADGDHRTVLVGEIGAELRLVRLDPSGAELAELARLPREALAFDLAPTGDRVALWRRDLRGTTAVEVVDLGDGRREIVVADGGVAAAWSPDGARLAVLVIEDGGTARWTFWDDAEVATGPAFRPTVAFVRDYLPFWDQYVRASTPWSPDSSALTHAEERDGIGVVVVQPADGAASTVIGDGDMSWWSPVTGRSPSSPVRP
ncbi:MAG: hypothetical protein AAGA17_08825 [Actinomycetota bacterium]